MSRSVVDLGARDVKCGRESCCTSGNLQMKRRIYDDCWRVERKEGERKQCQERSVTRSACFLKNQDNFEIGINMLSIIIQVKTH